MICNGKGNIAALASEMIIMVSSNATGVKEAVLMTMILMVSCSKSVLKKWQY